MTSFLAKERTIAGPGFNRWLVPPAALGIHLCIGMAYGFSVFWKPLQNALVGADGVPLESCSEGAVTFSEKLADTVRALYATDCNWTQFDLGWVYTLFFLVLGAAAALWGGWLERSGPRKAGRRRDALLVRRSVDLGLRRVRASTLAVVAWLGSDRRNRARAWIHLARLDLDQMVPRPTRSRHRHGHHGLWRWGNDWLATRHGADEHV